MPAGTGEGTATVFHYKQRHAFYAPPAALGGHPPMTEDYNPTEWLANCATGYGWGRTQQDALFNMFACMDPVPERADGPLVVDTVEHRGDATVSPRGWRVEELVTGQRFEFDLDTIGEIRSDALNVHVELERAIDQSDPDDIE